MFKFIRSLKKKKITVEKGLVKIQSNKLYAIKKLKKNKKTTHIQIKSFSKENIQFTKKKILKQAVKFFLKINFFRKKGFQKFFQKKLITGMVGCIFFKNHLVLKKTLKNILFWTHYKKHRNILISLKPFFRKNINTLTIFNGMVMSIKGRFMSPGGSKKRKKTLTIGQTSFKKNTKSTIHNIATRTPFGSLNIKLTIN